MPHMPKKWYGLLTAVLVASASLAGSPAVAQSARKVALGDWPEMRGPHRDGTSRETGLIDKWTLNGENFLWRVPYGGVLRRSFWATGSTSRILRAAASNCKSG